MKRILIVVDMQNDFVDGSLGSEAARSIVPDVVKKINGFDGDDVFVTYDTHYDNYMSTLEGKKLPVPHCIDGTHGHELNAEVNASLKGKNRTDIIKTTFGTFEISRILKEKYPGEEIEAEFLGLCTDICVISNVLILRAAYPNAVIKIDPSCCAGVSEATHKAALDAMSCCQIDIVK